MGNAESTGPVDMESAEAKYIQQTVDNNCVVIFSKSYCPYCDEADKIFKRLQVATKKIELDDRKDGDVIQNILGHMTDAYTVPRVFVNGRCIGGASETKALHKKGQLEELLKQCK
ncbi:glutaredoxin-2, mitochondrial-like [Ylistrum balloti]|uniref:glutaredoxin-2, mitochondrial-like n=1 Tax=Ylistrum balloti TaxID=509963 RepID=UPI002905E3B8|nr:glutaredoxin-2, mitochondrial-like [Ylistrum balloti]